MADHGPFLAPLAQGGRLGAAASHAPGAAPSRGGPERPAECRHYRQPECEDHGGGGAQGYDAAKQGKGRKRPVLVDTQGGVRTGQGQLADVMDRDGVMSWLPPAQIKAAWPRLTPLWLDAGYHGKEKGKDWSEKHLGWTTNVVTPPPRRGIVREHVEPAPRPAFTGLPRRWVVERTCAWWGQSRRLRKEYERLCPSRKAMIYATMSRLMVRRLAAA
jgi:transposase